MADTSTQAPTLRTLVHDMRNPLNAISMNAELAKLQLQSGKPVEEVVVCLERIVKECQKCNGVLEEISSHK